MELVEIPSRAGLDQDNNTNGNEEELAEARRATGVKKKCNHPDSCVHSHPFFLIAVAHGSKTYMLRSCLHPLSGNADRNRSSPGGQTGKGCEARVNRIS